MSILNRKLLRELYRAKGMLLAVTSIIAVGIMCYVSMQSAYNNLAAAKERSAKESMDLIKKAEEDFKMHQEERGLQLAKAMDELSDAQREALILQYWEGCSLKEIGQQLDRTEAAVAGLLHRGLKKLRQVLGSQA